MFSIVSAIVERSDRIGIVNTARPQQVIGALLVLSGGSLVVRALA
jgi:hypothetical protein